MLRVASVFLIIVGVTSISIASTSQASEENRNTAPFFNLSFSHFTEEGYPHYWYFEAPPEGLRVKQLLDGDQQGMSLVLSSTEPVVFYTPALFNECVTKLTAKAIIQSTEKISSSMLFLTPGGNGPDMAQPVPGNGSVQKISHTITAKNGCLSETLLMGVFAAGNGELFVKNIELSINGKSFDEGLMPKEHITVRELDNIKKDLIKINSLALHQPTKKSPEIESWTKQVEIVGLGENSHGAKALFLLKSKIIQHLIEHQAFTQFALEMPAASAITIDDYIKGRHKRRQEVIYALNYPSWQTRSMMTLIDWLRNYNQTHSEQISFSGFDVQQPKLTIQKLQKHIANTNDEFAENALTSMLKKLRGENFSVVDFDKDYRILFQHFEKQHPTLLRYIKALKQGLALEYKQLGEGTREQFMAMQTIALSRSQKTILWGDNVHISKNGNAMGAYIRKSLGDKYKAIGFSYHEGTYSAYGPNNPYRVHPSYDGTHESILLKLNVDNLLVNLNSLPPGSPLLDVRSFRYIGSRPQAYTQFLPHRLKDHFDLIGFSKQTEHTEYLIKHDFK